MCEPVLAPDRILHRPYDTKWPAGNSETFNTLQPRNKKRFASQAICCTYTLVHLFSFNPCVSSFVSNKVGNREILNVPTCALVAPYSVKKFYINAYHGSVALLYSFALQPKTRLDWVQHNGLYVCLRVRSHGLVWMRTAPQGGVPLYATQSPGPFTEQ